MKHSEDNDPAWDLLKHARKTEPAGNFTQNVMREIRQLKSGQDKARSPWFSPRLVGSMAAAAAFLIGSVVLLKPSPDAPVEPVQVVAAPVIYEEEITIEEFAAELEELAYLGDLMAVPDTSLLADEELATLLF